MGTGLTFRTYYAAVPRAVAAELARLADATVLALDCEAELGRLVSEARWDELRWDASQRTVEPFMHRGVSMLRLRVPLAPHPRRDAFLQYRPAHEALAYAVEPEWRFEGDTLVLETMADPAALEQAMAEFERWVGRRNADVRAGNATLRARIRAVLQARVRQAEAGRAAADSVVARLGIPRYVPKAKSA